MITAIYIYESIRINIVTSESGLELCQMGTASPIPLNDSNITIPVDRGIYKIVSTADVVVTAKPDSMRVERFNPKDTGPEQARRAVAETFPDITISQLQAFFTVADGRVLLNP